MKSRLRSHGAHRGAGAIAVSVMAGLLLATPVGAQHQHDKPAPVTPNMSAHMRMTPSRPATAADSVRARAVADTLRAAIAKYRDARVAEQDGYELFLRGVKTQRVYHFTKKWNAIRNGRGFDPARPTSLLYRKDGAGEYVLIGAMYTASKRSSEKDLDARVPLSIAQWHQHVDICVPKRGGRERWQEKRDGQMLFGPAGAISTEAECKQAGGRFIPKLFGWMVHANVFAVADPIAAWNDDHRMDPGEMGKE